jgi:hypothetical protein
MERVGVLTRAVRRLDAAAAELRPLRVAERGLAALTRVRLDGLTSPGRGDEALAAVLARHAPAGAAEADVGSRPPRRLVAPPFAAGPGRALAPAATVPPPRAVVPRSAGATVVADGRSRRVSPPSGPARTIDAAASRETRRRRTLDAGGSDGPAPPRGFDAVAAVAGLEWIAPRVPGGAEPGETTLVEGAPEAASPSRWAGAPAPSPQPRVLTAPTAPTGAALTAEVERVTEPIARRSWPVPQPTKPHGLPRAGGEELEALVRAWQENGSAQAERVEGVPVVIPVEGGTATSTPSGRSRARARPAGSQPEDETLAFSDALGRVLVAELRRYGIEVDAG